MKKSIFTLVFFFSLFSLVLNSCSKDDDSSLGLSDQSGSYQIIMDANIIAEGTSTQRVLLYENTLVLGGAGSDFVITITNVPETIGVSNAIELGSSINDDNSQLTISATNMLESGDAETYWGTTGTITRTSATKISFEATCQIDASGSVLYTFSGTVESEAFKVK